MNDIKFSDFDRRLQDIAMSDFEYFCYIAGVDKRQAAVCILRSENKSLQQIANRLGIPKSTVQDICKKCTEITVEK